MAKPGAKRKFETPEGLRRQVQAYLDMMLEKDELPTFAGMLRYLDISKRTYHRYMNMEEPDPEMTDEERHAYRKVFEDAQLVSQAVSNLVSNAVRREDYLERRMVREPRAANGCMNSLKQIQNGGFKEKIEADVDARITVNVIGVGGENAFK